MFLLSKILPLLLLPLGIVFLLLLLFALRGGRWLLISSLSVLWIFSLPLTAEGLWRWLEHPFKRRTVPSVVRDLSPSAVVVLGTGRHPAPGPSRISEWSDADRFFGGDTASERAIN